MSKAKTLTSGYKEIEAKTFDIAHDVPYLVLLAQCWAHWPRSSPADGPRLLVLDPLGPVDGLYS